MFDAEFEENSLKNIIQQSGIIAETMSQSVKDVQIVQDKVSGQFGSVFAEIKSQINLINTRLASSKSLKNLCAAKIDETRKLLKPLSPLPDRPSVPLYESPEMKLKVSAKYQEDIKRLKRENEICRQNNVECEKRINQLQIISKELDSAISILESCLQKLQSCATKIYSAQNEYESQRILCLQKVDVSAKNMYGWFNAAQISYDCALDILRCRDSVSGSGGLSSAFTINLSGRNPGSYYSRNSVAFSDTSGGYEESVAVRRNNGERQTVIVNEKVAAKVFEQIAIYDGGEVIIKIPASNLYKLGGQKFIDEMGNSYTLIQNDGGIIGNDGYISWRKKQ